MKQQPLSAQKGEIEFRKKLVQQQIGGECIFQDEFDAKGIERILNDRMETTIRQMKLLKEKGLTLSPYFEIGAERCQRALIMENDVGAAGAAVDISYEMLKSGDYYKTKFGKVHLPLRICCDINRLPFMSNTIPFVFCYETLHHFPDPTPIVKEIYRVISPGGHFFFDEEPYKRVLHINLYKAEKIYSKKSRNQGNLRKFLDFFFSELNCNEIEHGIIENHTISIRTWRKALNIFEESDVTLKSLRGIHSELFHPKHYKRFLAANLLGGVITGICRKAGMSVRKDLFVYDVLICPSCFKNKHEVPLEKRKASFFCNTCGKRFPIIDNVIFLFSHKKLQELYPEIFETLQKIPNDIAYTD